MKNIMLCISKRFKQLNFKTFQNKTNAISTEKVFFIHHKKTQKHKSSCDPKKLQRLTGERDKNKHSEFVPYTV